MGFRPIAYSIISYKGAWMKEAYRQPYVLK